MANKLSIGTSKMRGGYIGTQEIDKIYVGEHLEYIKSPYVYEWILNDTIDITNDFSFNVSFMCDGEEYDNLTAGARDTYRALEYNINNTGIFAYNTLNNTWVSTKYKTIYFKEKPSGDLLTWLTANGTKRYDIISAGTYKFKDNPDLTGIDMSETISYKFTLYGETYSGIVMNIYSNMIYYKTSTTTMQAYTGTSWQSTASTITIETEQNVTHEFYDWAITNNNLVKEEQQLATPQNVSIDGTTLSWDEVENATSYDIYADGTLLGNTDGGVVL